MKEECLVVVYLKKEEINRFPRKNQEFLMKIHQMKIKKKNIKNRKLWIILKEEKVKKSRTLIERDDLSKELEMQN